MNGPETLPRFSPASRRLTRRSDFLDGTYKTYFAPGQGAGVMDASSYVAPSDWRPANSLLRIPQVVWLSLAQYGGDAPDPHLRYPPVRVYAMGSKSPTTSGDSRPSVEYWTDGYTASPDTPSDGVHRVGSGTSTGSRFLPRPASDDSDTVDVLADDQSLLAGEAWAYDHAITNVQRVEYQRLSAVFSAVVSALAALRPGRTWGVIQDYVEVGGAPKTSVDRSSYLASPPDGVEFFGTDFLNIHAGSFSINGGLPGTAPSPGDTSTAESLAAARAALVVAAPKFARYASVLYGHAPGWQSYPAPPLIPIPPVDLPANPYSPGDPDYLSPYVFILDGEAVSDYRPILEGWNSSRTYAPPAITASYDARDSAIVDFLQSEAAALASSGISYGGDSASLTESTLLLAIASHFGFDPETGLDLPPG